MAMTQNCETHFVSDLRYMGDNDHDDRLALPDNMFFNFEFN